MLHCADLSNPAKPEHLATQWTDRVIEENFIQGDEEKNLGIPLSPLGDREQVSIGKCQVRMCSNLFYMWISSYFLPLLYPACNYVCVCMCLHTGLSNSGRIM